MRGSSVRAALAVCCAAGLLVSCGDDGGELVGMVREDPLQVGEVAVTEVTGGMAPAPMPFVADDGEVLVVYFGYTNCPDVCPTTLAALRSAKKALGDDGDRVDVAMVTVDPERDTAEVLDSYLASFTDSYHALVPASDEELRAAEDAFLVSSAVTKNPDGTVDVVHTGNAFVVDSDGVVRVEWPFGQSKDDMANDLQVLLDEA